MSIVCTSLKGQVLDRPTTTYPAEKPAKNVSTMTLSRNADHSTTFSWKKVSGAVGYELSTNDRDWTLVTATTFISRNTFSMIKIRSIFADGTKSPIVGAKIATPCGGALTFTVLALPTCYGDNDGSIAANFTGTNPNGVTPVLTYQLDGGAQNNQPTFSGIVSGGNHILIATDLLSGCKDTLNFFLSQPDSIKISTKIDTAKCSTNNLGKFTCNASGGTPPLTYIWNTFPLTFNPTISNVLGGAMQTVTVTDDRGCKKSAKFTMPVGNDIKVTAKIDSVQCFGLNNGKIALTITGATAPLTYVWKKNNQNFAGTGNTISNLSPAAYSVTITDATSCSYTNSYIVTEPTPLKLTTKVTPAGCTNPDGAISVSPKGGTPQYTYAWNYQNATTSTISNLGSGKYTVTATDKKGCKVDTSITMAFSNNITSTMQVLNTRCVDTQDGEATVNVIGSNGPFVYQWSDPAKQTSNNAKNLAEGVYYVTVTDVSGCKIIDTADVKKALPIDLKITPSVPKCFNSVSESISATVSGGNGNFSLLWSNNDNGLIIKNLKPGKYTVTATDDKGCTANSSADIIAPPVLEITNINSTNILCFGQTNGSAEVDASGGTGALTYQWNDKNAQIAKKALNLSAGVYIVTVSDANNCKVEKGVTVKEPAKLSNLLTVKIPSCFKSVDGEINNNPKGGVAPYTFAWDGLSAKTPSLQNINAGFYTISITDKNNCVLVDTITLKNPTPLDVTLQQVEKSCAGLKNSAAVVDVNGGVSPYQYQWNDANKSTSKQITKIAKGNYTVTITDANKCIVSKSITVTEYDSIIANLVFVRPKCFGDANGQIGISVLKGGSGNGDLSLYTYYWDTKPFQDKPAATDLLGDRTYTVSINDNVGCKGVAKIFLPQPKQITLTYEVTNVKCFEGSDASIKVSAKGENNTFGYSWSHDATLTTEKADQLIAGSYTVTATDNAGCENSAEIIVKEPTPLELASYKVKNNKCYGDEQGELSVEAKGGTAAYSYFWSNKIAAPKITGLKVGSYKVTTTDANGCKRIDTLQVKQPNELKFNITSKDLTCFGGKDGSIAFNAVGGTQPYTYSNNGSPFNGKNSLIGLRSGAYELVIKDGNGCLASEDVIILEPAKFEINLIKDTALYYGKSITLAAESKNNQGKVTYDWTAPAKDAISCAKCDSTIATVKTSMAIFVKATDSKGCVANSSVNIEIIRSKDVFVPTGFSPNFDGSNDKIIIHGREGTKVLWFRVFDRWGEQLYENTNFEVNCMMCGWDGTFKGALMPAGVYIWMAEVESINGERNILKGSTTLVR
jgi:gliding motility-associated-like protein